MATVAPSVPMCTPPAPVVPDDIPDPQTPGALPMAQQAGLERACLQMQERIIAHLDAALDHVRDSVRRAAQQNEHAQYQWSDALLKVQEQGIRVHMAPYSATVHARSPQGFAVDVQILKGDAGELVEAVTGLVGWLEQSRFTGIP